MNTLLHHDSRFEIKNIGATGVFSGYGSVYGNIDHGESVMMPGCFADSLSAHQAKSTMPAMLWQHRSSEPIGAYTRMSESDRGLYVEGQLAMKTIEGQRAHELLKMKAISGLSVGFLTREDSFDHKTGVRSVNKADLWEISLVTFPMNDQARVDQVKSIPEFDGISDFERFLRDTANLSRTEAGAVVAKARTMFLRDAANGDRSKAILEALAARAVAMRP
jgi:Escherichia/Staphylococcus phage prohead protease